MFNFFQLNCDKIKKNWMDILQRFKKILNIDWIICTNSGINCCKYLMWIKYN